MYVHRRFPQYSVTEIAKGTSLILGIVSPVLTRANSGMTDVGKKHRKLYFCKVFHQFSIQILGQSQLVSLTQIRIGRRGCEP